MHPEQDIDRLILELNATAPPEPAHVAPASTTRLDRWLRLLADRGGSDLLLVAGAPPTHAREGHRRAARRRPARRPRHRGSGSSRARSARPSSVPRPSDRRRVVPVDRARAFPHQPAPRTRPGRRRGAHAAAAGAAIVDPRSAAAGRAAGAAAARAGAARRSNRIGQDHHAGGAGRGNQPPLRAPHHHHRRSDRVRAHPRRAA